MARIREFDTEAAVEAAMWAFRRTGFEGTSIQDLVEATGVGRGSLYAAFGNKEGLYLAAVDRYRDKYALPLIEELRYGLPARELIHGILLDVVDEIVADGSRHACLMVSAAVERAPHDPEVRVRIRATTASLEDAFADLIGEQGLARGRDPRDVARFLMTTIHGMRVTAAITPDRAALTAIAEVALGCLA
ncbi:TetR/AcrR family transcriptional regulator [Herbidospora daliensis]|uniref:TetR/AcrR family transcriptional regulator n=1 Tax=Herbidospora daliensis TaxID=295585 RepID=UPI000781712C|nr:TetR/AcrR family transcriptional regulator [Herbidospora daliensis]